MPELRKDPIVGRWVIISTERSKRPSDFGVVREFRERPFCPFCPGHEEHTPPEILAERPEGSAPNTPGWMLRVVSNKFPALRIEGDLQRMGDGVYDRMNGVGAHEVIIETPVHAERLSVMPARRVEAVLRAFRERMRDLKKDDRLRYILIFKNEGKEAGASLEHSHSQLIALPIVPKRAVEELDGAQSYYQYKERCVYCDIVRQELAEKVRLIAASPTVIAIAPFASRFPFETWILPRRHRANFEEADDAELAALAAVFADTLHRLDAVLLSPPYNFVIHSSPFDAADDRFYHWHCEIMPKLTNVAGFEWGSGFYINPTPPEEAARFLREAEVE